VISKPISKHLKPCNIWQNLVGLGSVDFDVTLTTSILEAICHRRLGRIQSTCLQNLTILALAVPEISF